MEEQKAKEITEENKKKFTDEKHWGKVGYIITYKDGVAVHVKTIAEIDFHKKKSSLKYKEF